MLLLYQVSFLRPFIGIGQFGQKVMATSFCLFNWLSLLFFFSSDFYLHMCVCGHTKQYVLIVFWNTEAWTDQTVTLKLNVTCSFSQVHFLSCLTKMCLCCCWKFSSLAWFEKMCLCLWQNFIILRWLWLTGH